MMTVNKNVVDAEDVISQLEDAKKSMQVAKETYEKLKEKAADDLATKINYLVETAQFDAEGFYSRCFRPLIKDSDTAIRIAVQILIDNKPDDRLILKAFKNKGLLTSKRSATAGQHKSGASRNTSYKYELENGEREKLDNNEIKEGKHRHHPAHWSPTMGPPANKPEWSKNETSYAVFSINEKEKDEYDKYKAQAKAKQKTTA
ncbi:hypothetical protein HAP94_15905 [Acidithiobacillus ferrivorans]|nr:hypothetical protein [Acidithiobacillus ferrivorans]